MRYQEDFLTLESIRTMVAPAGRLLAPASPSGNLATDVLQRSIILPRQTVLASASWIEKVRQGKEVVS